MVRSFVDGDHVILRVHVVDAVEAKELAAVDIFRVKKGKLIEHRDGAAPIPEVARNDDGVF